MSELITDVPNQEMLVSILSNMPVIILLKTSRSMICVTPDEMLAKKQHGIIVIKFAPNCPISRKSTMVRKKAVGLLGAAKGKETGSVCRRYLCTTGELTDFIADFRHRQMSTSLTAVCSVMLMLGYCMSAPRLICAIRSRNA